MKVLAYGTRCVMSCILEASQRYCRRLVHATIHCLPSIHFSRRLHRTQEYWTRKKKALDCFDKPPPSIERQKYQSCWETEYGIFLMTVTGSREPQLLNPSSAARKSKLNINSVYLSIRLPQPRSRQYLQLVWLRLSCWPLISGSLAELVPVGRGEVVKNSRSTRAFLRSVLRYIDSKK